MKPFNVYSLADIHPVNALGSWLWDIKGEKYLDMYGGHAVISVGHSHPYYIQKLKEQLGRISFYSNSVQIGLQEELAYKLGKQSGCEDHSLFLCSSGAEANENALKLASFHNGRKKIIAIIKSFHGRTSLAVAATDDKKIQSPVNADHAVTFIAMNDVAALQREMNNDICAIIIEGVQGVGGIHEPSFEFLKLVRLLCDNQNTVMILDEVQSGYGRTGKFFAHQFSGVMPDIITAAKGMGNGFPIGGVLISEKFTAVKGQLGTTFGGNHLACAAGIAVLDIIDNENLLENSSAAGRILKNELSKIPGVKEVRGRGLMLGIEMDFSAEAFRNRLLNDMKIFTGNSSCKKTIRILPALNIGKNEIDFFLEKFEIAAKFHLNALTLSAEN